MPVTNRARRPRTPATPHQHVEPTPLVGVTPAPRRTVRGEVVRVGRDHTLIAFYADGVSPYGRAPHITQPAPIVTHYGTEPAPEGWEPPAFAQ